ncbi:MAG: CHASE2 domain-containing protein [Deltaproteobacteria bacterium]|nr:CHASE2 domain-containing protein [Deltaproteobacteria bacterium]
MVNLEIKKPIIPKGRRNNRRIFLFGIFFSVILFLVSLAKPSLTDFLHNRVYDVLLSGNTGQPSPVPLIVDIDEKSLQQYGQWPWPRYRIATLIEKLRNSGALSIGLDMMFPEEDRTSIEMIKKEFYRDFGIELGFKEIPHDLRNSDKRLADALSKGKIVLGYQFLFEEGPYSENCLLHSLHLNRLGQVRGEENLEVFIEARGVSCNLNMLSQAAGASGFFNVSPDPDGILRRVPLIIEHRGKSYPSLALATLMQSLNKKDVLLKTDDGTPESLCLDKTVIPLSSKGCLLIRFRGKSKTFEYISAADILSDRVPKEKIHGKIVFVGTSASGMKELRSTPLDPIFPGVEIHATVVDNIIKKDFLSRPRWVPGLESLLALGLGLLSTIVLAWTGAGWSSLLLGGMGVTIWQASVWIFRTESIFISPILSLIVLVCNFSLITFLKYRYEEKRVKERTREIAMVQEATIESLSALTETRDPDTGGHIKRTQNYVLLLADYLKHQPKFRQFLNHETIHLLCKSAPLHDIGKVGVSDRILLKPGKLTEHEFDEMKKHTAYGRDAILTAEKKLGNTSFLRFARDIAYTHHERWDGCGYPEGLKGDQIPISGRLMALADAYDAITSERVYKAQLPHEQAVQIIAEARGSQFDPDVVDAFLDLEENFRNVATKYADS